MKIVLGLLSLIFISFASYSQEAKLYEIFSTKSPETSSWSFEGKNERKGGYSKESDGYIYLHNSKSPLTMSGLSIPIRQNPGPGQFRYITFAWIKWGGEQIGMRFVAQDSSATTRGGKYGYTYLAGNGYKKNDDRLRKGLKISPKAPGNWIVETRDLWKDFGDFTITGIEFLCPESRDAGFDEIFISQTKEALPSIAPSILPEAVAAPVDIDETDYTLLDQNDKSAINNQVPEDEVIQSPVSSSDISEAMEDEIMVAEDGVKINWAKQIKAGGVWMYPLYALGVIALVVAIWRLLIVRTGHFAPKKLRQGIRNTLKARKYEDAIDMCYKHRCVLASSALYILIHRNGPFDAVSQTAGDMAARAIKSQYSMIYPLSVVASLAPLMGLLGTVIGMIEAFGLVALYGDEGGASVLSDSISKALITTAAGLIIAVPAIILYYIIKNRIAHISSVIETEIEFLLTSVFLDKKVDKTDDNEEATSTIVTPVNSESNEVGK